MVVEGVKPDKEVTSVSWLPHSSTWLRIIRSLLALVALRKDRTQTTSTVAKSKTYAPAGGYMYVEQEQQQNMKSGKRDFVPVYVAIGMIVLSAGKGAHTAWQQLRNSPGVRVKKRGGRQ
ncbi:hypothetical protein Fmac_029455 [Flemingia macrophylla]|uniref:Uncharacterized protein n=1 Tax=Flemingia macrophylla TaxID=520843 RepID=A0ABD1LAD7_9FABA